MQTTINPCSRQNGVVLIITLIVLVAMTMAAIAMIRSVDTTNIIAGNLAFRQATTHSADSGVEAAISWLEANNGTSTLNTTSSDNGYVAHLGSTDSPTGTTTWPSWWDAYCGTVVTCKNNGTDSVGNKTEYVIHRLCKTDEDPGSGTNKCTASVVQVESGSEDESGKQKLITKTQIYYRITAKVSGPRNSTSYIQAIIAL